MLARLIYSYSFLVICEETSVMEMVFKGLWGFFLYKILKFNHMIDLYKKICGTWHIRKKLYIDFKNVFTEMDLSDSIFHEFLKNNLPCK